MTRIQRPYQARMVTDCLHLLAHTCKTAVRDRQHSAPNCFRASDIGYIAFRLGLELD